MKTQNLTPAQLIHKLSVAGRYPQPDLINAIWERRAETEPLLLTLFAESFDDNWPNGDDPRWYRFIHAGKFLLSWQNLESLPTFARLYGSDDRVMQDILEWFEEDLLHFGPPVIPYLAPIIGKDSGNKWDYGKGLSGSILTKVATYYPETREEIAAIFQAQLPLLDAMPTDTDEMWGNWAAELGELADEASRDQITGLAEAGIFSREFFSLQSYRQEMNRGFKPQKPPKPYDIREDYRSRYDTEQVRKKRLERERAQQRVERIRDAQPRTEPKIGRNAPCACGSGKKYKKCHGRSGHKQPEKEEYTMMQKQTLEIGDIVKVRQGFEDPDTKIDMGGWHGRITQFYPEHGTALIAFDSITLQNLPDDYIEECEADGVSWSEYGYDLSHLTKVDPRDTVDEATKMLKQVEKTLVHNYLYLGKEGKEIRDILRTVDPNGELGALDAWLEYLEQELKFPLEAVVDEWVHGPLRSSDKVRIHAFEAADEHYGIIVKVRRGRKQFHAPLFQLAAANENSREYNLIDLYRTWFANH